jgi:hypothetical protein
VCALGRGEAAGLAEPGHAGSERLDLFPREEGQALTGHSTVDITTTFAGSIGLTAICVLGFVADQLVSKFAGSGVAAAASPVMASATASPRTIVNRAEGLTRLVRPS